jgi:hypothetical protein
MNAANLEYLQVWQQVKDWPVDLRQDLIGDISKSVDADLAANGAWDEIKNARRCELIDKDLQGEIDEAERRELELLTRLLRLHRQKSAPLPIVGATQLH